jgi:hypothetical protein
VLFKRIHESPVFLFHQREQQTIVAHHLWQMNAQPKRKGVALKEHSSQLGANVSSVQHIPSAWKSENNTQKKLKGNR